MKNGIAKTDRKLTITRLETWATPGVPDLVILDELGRFSFVELKNTATNAIALSPHQVNWLCNHAHGSAWILVRRRKDGEKATIRVYHASKAIDARMDGIKCPADMVLDEPFDWDEIMGLICPI